jgi:uncharacterized protein
MSADVKLNAAPTGASERHIVLDALRGLALLGICLANFPEFSLYTFQPAAVVDAYTTAGIDRVIKYAQYIFIDGKFYSLFSLLFGVGFAIIICNPAKTTSLFLRRMTALAVIGFLHLMFVWSGDILLLYALLGMLLPLFRKVGDKKLLAVAAVLILLPVALDAFKSLTGGRYDPALPVVRATQHFNARYGITDDNFPVWLRDADNYGDMLKFLVSGAFIRCREFIDGNRVFKVLGLFLIGLYIGRRRIYATLEANRRLLTKVAAVGFAVGLPVSCIYAWCAMHPDTGIVSRAAAYAFSVVPMSLAYAAAVAIYFMRRPQARVFQLTAAPGRLALSNYIAQSVAGIIIYYGTGFALGASMGLVYVELVAAAIWLLEVALSLLWLKYFRFGPLEWLWRMFTYKKRFKLLKQTQY